MSTLWRINDKTHRSVTAEEEMIIDWCWAHNSYRDIPSISKINDIRFENGYFDVNDLKNAAAVIGDMASLKPSLSELEKRMIAAGVIHISRRDDESCCDHIIGDLWKHDNSVMLIGHPDQPTILFFISDMIFGISIIDDSLRVGHLMVSNSQSILVYKRELGASEYSFDRLMSMVFDIKQNMDDEHISSNSNEIFRFKFGDACKTMRQFAEKYEISRNSGCKV